MTNETTAAVPVTCTCCEIYGEDPNCALHGAATPWALENYLPSDWQELVIRTAAQPARLTPLGLAVRDLIAAEEPKT